jgi:hypothetical protein
MSAIGGKRTLPIALHMSAFDPKRTLGQWKICDLGHSGGREQPPRCGLNLGAIAMFANLGKVIYWVAYAVALLMFGLATLVWFTETAVGRFGTHRQFGADRHDRLGDWRRMPIRPR